MSHLFARTKYFIELKLPWVASQYRFLRDQYLTSRLRMTKTPLGFYMIGFNGMVESRFGSGELSMFVKLLESTDIFVDVGANYGVFTLTAKQSGVQSIAFEPNQENCKILFANLRQNNFLDVEIFPIAVSKSPNLLPLFGGIEGASLEKNWGGMMSTYSRLVPSNTLDNIIGSRFAHERLLIKIDVEGHEFSVLEGSLQLLARNPAPTWLLEHGFSENFSGHINPRFRQLFELFWRYGYTCVTADQERRVVSKTDVERWLVQGSRDFGYLNYLFSKESIDA